VLSLHTNLSFQDLQHISFEDLGAMLGVTSEQAEARAGMMMGERGMSRSVHPIERFISSDGTQGAQQRLGIGIKRATEEGVQPSTEFHLARTCMSDLISGQGPLALTALQAVVELDLAP